jgi:hypothetical protein
MDSLRQPNSRKGIRQHKPKPAWRQPIQQPSHRITNANERSLRQASFTPLLGAKVLAAASLQTDSISPEAVAVMKKSTSMPLKQYRKQLARERKKGSLAHRRYTFSQCPLLEIDVDEFIVLRPAWDLDRFCGPQLYWQTFFDFGEEKDHAANNSARA